MKNIIFQIICCAMICSSLTGLCQESIRFNCRNNLNGNAISDLKNSACMNVFNNHVAEKNKSNKNETPCLIKANKMLNYYVQAEFAFYNRLTSDALRFIGRSLEVIETAEAYTLKAHLYYKQGKTGKYKMYLNKAQDLMNHTDQRKINDIQRSHSNSLYSVLKPAAKHTLKREQNAHSEEGGK